MKISFLLPVMLLAAGTALADVNYNMAIQEAKRVAHTPGPGQSQPPQRPPAVSHKAPPVNPELAATMKNIADLRQDIAAVVQAEDAAAADQQRVPLMNHLAAAAMGTKASPKTVKKLAGDLITAIGRRPVSAPQQSILARNLHALFNCAQLSATQQKTLLDAVKKILNRSDVAPADATKVIVDLKAVTVETKKT